MNILFIGDIVSKLGRTTVQKVLPELKEQYSLDVVFANGENLAHGKGVTLGTINDVLSSGISYLTSGNHVFWQKDTNLLLDDPSVSLLRPANYPSDVSGRGWEIINLAHLNPVGENAGKSSKVLLINILGRSFFTNVHVNCPFRTVDAILNQVGDEDLSAIIVDFHAEATSEKKAMGWYLDGRVTAVLGTHTHVPTADAWVLPQKTAYVTDIGMVGAQHSVLGVDSDIIIDTQKNPGPQRFEWVEEGPAVFNSVLVKVDNKGIALEIERIDRIVS